MDGFIHAASMPPDELPIRSAARLQRLSRRPANAIRRRAVFTTQIAVRNWRRPYRKLPAAHGLANDNGKAESFMKTLKVSVVEGLRNIRGGDRRPRFPDEVYNHRRLPPGLVYLRAARREASRARLTKKPHGNIARAAERVHSTKGDLLLR